MTLYLSSSSLAPSSDFLGRVLLSTIESRQITSAISRSTSKSRARREIYRDLCSGETVTMWKRSGERESEERGERGLVREYVGGMVVRGFVRVGVK